MGCLDVELWIGPQKSIWISEFGLVSFCREPDLVYGMIVLMFLPCFRHISHSCAFVRISRVILGHQKYAARLITIHEPK